MMVCRWFSFENNNILLMHPFPPLQRPYAPPTAALSPTPLEEREHQGKPKENHVFCYDSESSKLAAMVPHTGDPLPPPNRPAGFMIHNKASVIRRPP